MAAVPVRVGLGHPRRDALLQRANRLAYLTVGWNLVEGGIAIAAALAAGSIALLGFGVESFVESASGGVILWRILAERRARHQTELDQVEERARRLVAASLVLLAAYVAYESVTALVAGLRPRPSLVGLALAVASLAVMRFLAVAKRRTARALGSRAMEADAFQTDACFWLSLILLVGVGLNAAFGWWWADPLAALAMTIPIGMEAREAWRGESDCCDVC